MAPIAAILEAAGRDMEDSEAEDGYTVLPTSEGVAVGLATAHHMTTERFPTFRTAWRGSVERLGCRLWLALQSRNLTLLRNCLDRLHPQPLDAPVVDLNLGVRNRSARAK